MGLFDFFRRKALTADPSVVQSLQERNASFYPLIATPPSAFGAINARVVEVQSGSYGWIYWNTPAVRTVVDFIARNVAQLALRLYERTSDIERHQVSDHPAAESLRYPNNQTPGQQFIFDFTASWLVNNNAYALKVRKNATGPITLLHLPSHMVGVIGMNRFEAEGYRIYRTDGTWFDVAIEDIVHWRGYNPEDSRKGISVLETLRKTLAEDAAAQEANLELMKSGLARPGWIGRSLDAPEWSEPARERFEESWANRSRESNRKTPVIEEGMEFHDYGISPKDAQMLDGRRFTLEQVCEIYGVPIGLLGLGGVTQLDQQHQQFYADVLPPITEMFASYLNLGLLVEEFNRTDLYFEFDLDEKLMGDERLKALTSAAGGPVMLRNEARATLNLPPIPDGDTIITPLNVTVGGKPSPAVMPVQDPNAPPQDGSHRLPAGQSTNGYHKELEPEVKALLVKHQEAQIRRRDAMATEFEDLLRSHFAHQESSMKSKGHKAQNVASTTQNVALSALLLKLLHTVMFREGNIVAARLGLPSFDLGEVLHYLQAFADGRAAEINRATQEALDTGQPVADVFAEAKDVRAVSTGMTFATKLSSFAQVEAAKQTPDVEHRIKRWHVQNTKNSKHPYMDGETALLTEPFKNGKQMPPFEHPGCQCTCTVS